jgi:hypothetical protein
MIGSSLRILFLGIGSLILSWAAFLLVPSFSQDAVVSENSWFSRAFPSAQRSGLAREGNTSQIATALLQFLPFGLEAVRPLESILRRRSEVAAQFVPVFGVSLAAAFMTALLVRERLRFGTGYASPTVSFLAKRMAEAAVIVFFLLTFSPFPLPYWVFYLALGATTLGTFGYFSNLPLRL